MKMRLSQRIKVTRQYSARATYSQLRKCILNGKCVYSRRRCIEMIIEQFGWDNPYA